MLLHVMVSFGMSKDDFQELKSISLVYVGPNPLTSCCGESVIHSFPSSPTYYRTSKQSMEGGGWAVLKKRETEK